MAMATQDEVREQLKQMKEDYERQILETKDSIVGEFTVTISNLNKTIEEMNMLYGKDKMDREDKGKGKVFHLCDKRSFQKIPTFGGKLEDYEDWKFKIETFLNEEPGFQQINVRRKSRSKPLPIARFRG